MDIESILAEFSARLPKFPDGRIDYTHSDEAAVVSVFVTVGDELLLVRRSDAVRTHQGLWGAIGGYLDEPVPARQKILEELREELGIGEELVASCREAEPYAADEPEIGKRWVICPAKVELATKPGIQLDWEHTDYAWVRPDDVTAYQTVPGFQESWRRLN